MLGDARHLMPTRSCSFCSHACVLAWRLKYNNYPLHLANIWMGSAKDQMQEVIFLIWIKALTGNRPVWVFIFPGLLSLAPPIM
ncbi:unnamed protein product [Urochloa humidicola]